MAQGTVIDFDSWVEGIGNGVFDMSGDVFKMGIINNSLTPVAAAADARWGAGGAVDYSANEVTPGGNYAAGGPSLSAVITDNWTSSGGTVTFNGDDISIAQNASNPSNGYWGIIYDDTIAGKNVVAFIELGGPIDFAAGLFTITWHANGIVRIV